VDLVDHLHHTLPDHLNMVHHIQDLRVDLLDHQDLRQTDIHKEHFLLERFHKHLEVHLCNNHQ